MYTNILVWLLSLLIVSGCSTAYKNPSTHFIDEGAKGVNMIIMVDDKLADFDGNSMTKSFWVLHRNDQDSIKIPFRYKPGVLLLSDKNYQQLMNTAVDSVYLQFTYTYRPAPEDCEEKEFYSDEKFDSLGRYQHVDCDLFEFYSKFDRSWLDRDYVIMEIYHTKRNRYGDIYLPLPERDYTYRVSTGKDHMIYDTSYIEMK